MADETPSQTLCNPCSWMHFHRMSPPGSPNLLYYVLHWTKKSFCESVRQGCHVCVMISSLLDMSKAESPYYDEPDKSLDAFMFLTMSWHVEWVRKEGSAKIFGSEPIIVRSKIGMKELLSATRRLVPDQYRVDLRWPFPCVASANGDGAAQEGAPSCPYQPLVSSDHSTGSMANFELAKLWLTNCEQHHDSRCTGNLSGVDASRAVPIRLINVSDPHRPFLQDTAALPDPIQRYVTLSYCWGPGQRLTTTESTLPAFGTSLPVPDLPKTFQDAIYAAYMLGIPFLWIDALCIVQDRPEELAHEISIMGSIYQKAHLTIAATGSPCASHGLFQRRDPRWTRPCEVFMRVTAEDGTISGRITIGDASGTTGPDYLSRRGWVLQESVLSRRILYLQGDMISWSCMSHVASESGPEPMRIPDGGRLLLCYHDHRPPEDVISFSDNTSTTGDNHSSHSRRACFNRWYSLVQNFSLRDLSVPSDTLPALAGLAQQFHAEHHPSTYFAGLWQEDLQVGLAWYVSARKIRLPYQPPAIAAVDSQFGLPSWSWSSAGRNEVRFRGWQQNSREVPLIGAQLVQQGTSCVPANWRVLFGQVQHGACHLSLRGPLKPALLRWDWEYWRNRPQDGGTGAGDDEKRCYEAWGETPRFPALVCDASSGKPVGTAALDGGEFAKLVVDVTDPPHSWLTFSQERDQSRKLEMQVWCLLILARVKYGKWQSSCLLLKREGQGYRRIGLLFLGDLEWFGTLEERFGRRHYLEGSEYYLADEAGQELIGETVTIF